MESNVAFPQRPRKCSDAQEFTDATKYGPYWELVFLLMHRETHPIEPVESLFSFAQPNAQQSAGNDHLSQGGRSSAAEKSLVRAAPMAQQQALISVIGVNMAHAIKAMYMFNTATVFTIMTNAAVGTVPILV